MLEDTGVALEYSSGHERLRLEAWGEDSIRVRAGQAQIAEELPGALITPRPAPSAGATSDGTPSSTGSSRLRSHPTGWSASGAPTTAGSCFPSRRRTFGGQAPRLFLANGNGHYRIEQRFKAYDGREALRSRSAPPRSFQPKGTRHGPGPAKCGGFGSLHGLEQGLRVPLELAGGGAG